MMEPEEEIEAEDDEEWEEDQEEEPEQVDQGKELEQFLAQSQIGDYRSWLKGRRYERASELQTLKNILEELTPGIKNLGRWRDNLNSTESTNLRAYMDIQRRIRDLIREERDDLKWLWELEHREYILERRANKPEPQEEPNADRQARGRQTAKSRANGKPKWNFKKPKPKT
jgi:hypothetical protein